MPKRVLNLCILLLLFVSDSFVTLWTVVHQAPLSMGFWSGLPLPSSGDLSNPGTEPASPALAGHWATREALLVICSYPKSGQAEDQMCLCLIGGVCHTTEAKGVCTLTFISDYEWKVLHPMKEISVTSDWLYEVYFGWSGPSCPWSITQ